MPVLFSLNFDFEIFYFIYNEFPYFFRSFNNSPFPYRISNDLILTDEVRIYDYETLIAFIS